MPEELLLEELLLEELFEESLLEELFEELLFDEPLRAESSPLIAWATIVPLGSEENCQNMQPVLNWLCL